MHALAIRRNEQQKQARIAKPVQRPKLVKTEEIVEEEAEVTAASEDEKASEHEREEGEIDDQTEHTPTKEREIEGSEHEEPEEPEEGEFSKQIAHIFAVLLQQPLLRLHLMPHWALKYSALIV